jgi:predicted dehydrogenase
MYRYHPRALKLQNIMADGILGDLQYIYAVLSFQLETAYANNDNAEEDIRMDPSLGGGSLWDLGYYAVNFARMVADTEPCEVRGWSRDRKRMGVDDAFYGTLAFPNDVIAHIECGFSQPRRFHGEIVGSKGMISLPYAYGFLWDGPEEPTLRTEAGDSVISTEQANPYEREIAHLCDCVLENKPRIVPLDDARNNVAVVDALHKSAMKGISIPMA